MLRVCVSVLLLAVLVAAGQPDPYRPHINDQLATCDAQQIAIDLVTVGEYDTKQGMTMEELKAHVGDVTKQVSWRKVSDEHFSDVDSLPLKILGTTGGDFGEFVRALAAHEKLQADVLEYPDVVHFTEKLFRRSGHDFLYYSTHHHVVHYIRTILEKQFPQFESDHFSLDAVPEYAREGVLNMLTDAQFITNEYVKALLAAPDAYGVRSELVIDAIRAYFVVAWKRTGRAKVVLMDDSPAHNERAAVYVYEPNQCHTNGFALPIAPVRDGQSIFVYHVDAVAHYRAELAELFKVDAKKTGDYAEQLRAALDAAGKDHFEKFVAAVGPKGIPTYEVSMR